MKSKRIVAMLLAVVMLFTFVSVIAACQQQDECEKNGHTLTRVAKKEATTEEAGYEAYWKCSVCNKLFSDSEGKNEITKPVEIPKLTPEPHVCGHKCPTCGKCTDSTCTDPVCADKCQGHQTIAPDKGKTKENPLTPEEAIALMKKAGSGFVVGAAEKQQYYVQGVVNTGSKVDTEYHEWSFTLGTGSEKVTCQATVDNSVSQKPTETNGALDGATVVIHGFLELYQGAYKIAYLPANASPTGAKFTPVLVDIVVPVAEVASITLDHTEDMVLLASASNKYMDLKATVLPANAPQDVTWSVSENTANITVSSSGRISWTETEGEATITATAKDTNKSASVKVKVENVHGSTAEDPLTVDEAIALLTEDGKEVFAGYSMSSKVGFYLTGKVQNSVYNQQNVNSYWTFDLVGNNGTLSCICGAFSGVSGANGNLDDYTVVMRNVFLKKVSENYTAYDALLVSATRPALTGIQIDESANIDMGGTVLLQASPVPANALLGDDIEWHTSAEQTATVENGVVRGVAAGSAEITASVGDVTSNKCTVTVNAVEVAKAVYDWTASFGSISAYTQRKSEDLLESWIKVWSPEVQEITAFVVENIVTGPRANRYSGLGYKNNYSNGADGSIKITTEHQIKKITFNIVPGDTASLVKFSVNGESRQENKSDAWTGTIESAIDFTFTFAEATDTINLTAPNESDNQFVIVGITLEW